MLISRLKIVYRLIVSLLLIVCSPTFSHENSCDDTELLELYLKIRELLLSEHPETAIRYYSDKTLTYNKDLTIAKFTSVAAKREKQIIRISEYGGRCTESKGLLKLKVSNNEKRFLRHYLIFEKKDFSYHLINASFELADDEFDGDVVYKPMTSRYSNENDNKLKNIQESAIEK